MAAVEPPTTRRVVTYVQANGRRATTVVDPAQYAALDRAGRLVTDHGRRGTGRR